MKVSRLIELLQEFEKDYGDLPVVLKGRGYPEKVDRVKDPFPEIDTDEIPYFNGGCCLIERFKF